jgi:ribonucleoside-diphosphate reductase alpha chain/ribonucleoside-triphosphate reductase
MDSNRKDVAKNYIIYRNAKAATRKQSDPNRLLSDCFISKYKHQPSPMGQLGNFVFYRTYSRWLPDEKRREYWWETVRRAVEYNCSLAPTSKQEAEQLFDNIYNMKQFLSGRTLYTGGTEASRRFPMSNYNCSFAIADDFEAFSDLFTLLLIGAGVGLRARKIDVQKLPSVRGDIKVIHKAYAPLHKRDRKEYTCIDFEDDMVEIYIGDSKEGWRQALDFFFKMFYLSEYSKVKTIILNYDSVRPQGERLKTFGGYASGHDPLMKMFDKLYSVITSHNTIKKKLKPIDCLDIANIIGNAVVSGGVRRTSEVILFDPDDEEILTAKSNLYYQDSDGKWQINNDIEHRRMSNNTIQYYSKPTREQWHNHITEMRYSGEPAFSNMEAAQKRRPDAEGGNP